MKHAFNTQTRRLCPRTIVDSIYDWHESARYAHLRMTFEDCRQIATNLKRTLTTACPDVKEQAVFDVFEELARRDMIGSEPLLRSTAEDIAAGFIAAQEGNPAMLAETCARLQRRLDYLEKYYPESGEKRDIPLNVYADAFDQEKVQQHLKAQEKLEYVHKLRRKKGPQPA